MRHAAATVDNAARDLPCTGAALRLPDFIQFEIEAILVEWETFAAAQLPAAAEMKSLALRDHAKQILQAIARDIRRPQTEEAQTLKSMGRAPAASGYIRDGGRDTRASSRPKRVRHHPARGRVPSIARQRAAPLEGRRRRVFG